MLDENFLRERMAWNTEVLLKYRDKLWCFSNKVNQKWREKEDKDKREEQLFSLLLILLSSLQLFDNTPVGKGGFKNED